MVRTPHLTNEDGEEIPLPFRFEICGHCDGHGTSSAYLGAYTSSEMAEAGPEFREDYFAGRYDRTCEECGGTGKIKVADYSRMTKQQISELELDLQIDRELQAEHEAERRYGC